jgi:hypothetical protein
MLQPLCVDYTAAPRASNVSVAHHPDRAQGELDRAVTELEQVVELDRQVGHPDLQSDTEMLHCVRQKLASSDPGR